jgi:hypothetical protein
LFRRKGLSASFPPFSASADAFGGGVIFRFLDLPGGDIDNQLSELDRVARALETLRCHAVEYGMLDGSRKTGIKSEARLLQFKLTHYLRSHVSLAFASWIVCHWRLETASSPPHASGTM